MEVNETIDLRQYLRVIKKKLWLIILLPLLMAFSAGIVSKYFMDKVYESSTSLYVTIKQTDGEKSLNYNELLAAQALVKDFREMLKQKTVAKSVIDELNLNKVMTPEELVSKISVSLKNDTRFLEIKVQDKNVNNTALIANKVAEVFSKKVLDIMNVKNVEIFDKAEVPKGPIKPRTSMNVAIAFFIGLMAAVGIIFLLEFLDNTIKTAEDVERYLQMPVIGTIPTVTNVK